MSIVVAHGYSMMYANQQQGTGTPSALAAQVIPAIFKAATFSSGTAPSSKAELDQFSAVEDFNLAGLLDGEGAPVTDWAAAWVTLYWVKVGGKFYRWDGDTNGWVNAPLVSEPTTLAPLSEFDADERYFYGRYPQTKKELDTIVLSEGAFPLDQYICLVGRGAGAHYFWDGSVWVAGESTVA